MTQFTTTPVMPSAAEEFERYAYPPPHDFYDAAPGSAAVFLDPAKRYFSVIDGNHALWGFGCLGA